jgi:hypothetical protein
MASIDMGLNELDKVSVSYMTGKKQREKTPKGGFKDV